VTAEITEKDRLEIIPFATAADWKAWLESHHADSPGIWLKFARKESGIPSVGFPDALNLAVCYGWIDSQRAPFEDPFYLQKFTPRRPRSRWSKVNCDRAEALIASGQMQPAGLREVEAAKADGRWERAYPPQSQAVIPDDLQTELDRNPAAQDFFRTLNSANRYAIVYRVQSSKNPEIRAAHIRKFVEMLANHEKIYP
jgi:uncharacterized protein YdeI (YjbR/CyaY-like superfamily)